MEVNETRESKTCAGVKVLREALEKEAMEGKLK
jgi:hypothetical protein